jgi:2-iminobutanoate/2-iminopropanoate deaminase
VSRQSINSAGSAPAIGPYSPALRVGNLLFLSGQIPLDPVTGQVVEGDIAVQTRRVLDNMVELLKAADTGVRQVAKTTIYLADMADFATVNEIYASYFSQPYPARATVQVARLPRDVRVEIDAIAVIET